METNTETPITAPETPAQRLSPAQELELEKLRADNTAARIELEHIQSSNRAKQEAINSAQKAQAAREALRSAKVTFHNPEEAVKLLEADEKYDVQYAGGRLSAIVNGERVEFSEALKHFALKNEVLCDGRSLRFLRQNDPSIVRSRADLKTVRERVDYTNQHGDVAWADLPATPPPPPGTPETLAEFSKLRVSERVALINKLGPVEGWLRLGRL